MNWLELIAAAVVGILVGIVIAAAALLIVGGALKVWGFM